MVIQLNPMLPLYVPEFDMEGYAFLVSDYGQENYKFFTVAMDNGEIWELDNRKVRFCINYTASRARINKTPYSELLALVKHHDKPCHMQDKEKPDIGI